MNERELVYAGLSVQAAIQGGIVTQLCDACEDAEAYHVAGKLAQAARLLNDAAHMLAPKPAARAHLRWTPADDERLRATYGETLRSFRGDTERTCESLARTFGRSPVAIAARLCGLGLWRV